MQKTWPTKPKQYLSTQPIKQTQLDTHQYHWATNPANKANQKPILLIQEINQTNTTSQINQQPSGQPTQQN